MSDSHNAVVTDYELERGDHPIGKLVHLSTVTHAWRGVLAAVSPSYFIFSNEHPVALVDSTGAMGEYLAEPKAASPGDEFKPGKKGTNPTVRVPRAAVAWLVSW